jgi:ABC-type transporter Mla maintaining outer membrane lipid asymmetry permease subunit MlaE
MATRLFAGDPLAARALAEALRQFVWAPLPTLLALSALIGVIAGILVARLLAVYNAETVVVGVLDVTLLRQVLPLIVGIFASGSVAVELTARLGAMSLANEIDALESLGHDPVAHVLGPPLVAIIAAAPLHMTLAGAAALLGAGLPLALGANLGWHALFGLALTRPVAAALLGGIAKTVVFAWLAFAVGSAIGARPVRRPAEIGRRTRRAFTAGLLATFAAAALWVALA